MLDIFYIIAALFNIIIGIAAIKAASDQCEEPGCVGYISLVLGLAMLIAWLYFN